MCGPNGLPLKNDNIRTNSRFGGTGLRYRGRVCASAQGRIVFELVQRARRRLFRNELLSQGANTGSVALLVFILLLLLGTEILNWQLLAALPLAAAIAGFVLARRRLPSAYSTAQIVDRRMGLYDAISTAVFFRAHPPADSVRAGICAAQQAKAEQVSRTVDLRLAIPYRVPRAAYIMAGLLLVASSLFGLRYGLTRRLDLRTPLARMIQQRLGYPLKSDVAKNNPRVRPPQPGQNEDAEDGAKAEDRSATERDPEAESQEPEGQTEMPAAANKQDGKKNGLENSPDVKPINVEGQESEDSEDGEPEGNPGTPGNAKGDSPKDGSAKPEGSNSNENSSLLSKIKDAMQNLLSKIKPQQGGQQQASDQGGQQKNQPGKKQQASKDGQQQQGAGQQSEGQEGESGEESKSSQDSDGKSASKSDSPQTNKQPGSGMGSQEGDKSIKLAEQLAAMGKISEIIGKRTATLSGEATVEVQSTKQTLHTPYAQRGAQHTQAGAEINRDEIPVALQGYVQQYFEQVRKQAPPVKK